jgi:hypothetical protein
MASCIRCGLIPAPGSRYCAACDVARRGSGVVSRGEALRVASANRERVEAALAREVEFAAPTVSEEYAAHTDGRIARLEDEVASLRRQLVALADRTAERLEAERLQALTLPELLAAIDSAVEGARRLCGDVEPPIAADGASEEASR